MGNSPLRGPFRGEAPPDSGNPDAVLRYLGDKALPIYDPFCGGGSIPLEAQRLGMRAVGSDLNPVAVLITKALIELPPKFANKPPVNPEADPMGMTVGKGKKAQKVAWRGAAGLAGRHPVLRAEDAGNGLGTHRPPLPQSQAARRRRGYGHRLVVGQDRPLSQPCL